MQEDHIQSKQINRILSGYVNIPSVTVSLGSSSINLYSTIVSVSATAGYKGTAIEVKQSTDEAGDGFIMTAPNNIVLVNLINGNRKIFINRSEVYGKITYVNTTTYTLSFYYLNSTGVETVYTFDEETIVSFKVPYRYLLHKLPSDFAIELKSLVKGEIESALEIIPEASDTWKDSVISIVTDPSTFTPTEGDRYLVNSSAIGVFSGEDDKVATWNGSSWDFTTPENGFTVKVKDNDTVLYHYEGVYPLGSWILQPFLTSPLGLPTSGIWDGMFDFENTKTVDALDEINKVMAALAPQAAPSLQSWNELTLTPQVNGRLSFSTTVPDGSYNPANTPGIVNPVGLAGLFTESGLRLGITSRTGNDLSGIFNYDVAASGTLPTPSYQANSFKNADKGTLKLYINNVEIVAATIDLTSTTSTIDTTTGGVTTGLYVSASLPAYFPSGGEFNTIQHRIGGWKVLKSDLENGYNKIVVKHIVSVGVEFELGVIDIIVDEETDAVIYTGQSINVSSLTGAKYLSGVKYYTGGSGTYNVTISNAYKNTYSPASDAISYIGDGCSATSQVLPTNTAGVNQQVVISNKDFTITAIKIINDSISISTTVKRTVQAQNASTPIESSKLLLDNTTNDSTDLVETFNSETRRLPSNIDFDNFSNFLSSTWDSEVSIKDSDAYIGYADGLQVIDGSLIYPGNYPSLPSNFTTANIPLSPVWNNGGTKGSSRNYTTANGNKVFYRYFKQSTPTVANFILNIQGSSINFISTEGTLTGNNCKIELKAPSQTGWMDCYKDFETEQFSNTDGCRNASLGLGRNVNTNWGLTIGTKNTSSTGGYIVLKITVGENFVGKFDEINIQFV